MADPVGSMEENAWGAAKRPAAAGGLVVAAGLAVVAPVAGREPVEEEPVAEVATGFPICHCKFLFGIFLVNTFVSGFDQI